MKKLEKRVSRVTHTFIRLNLDANHKKIDYQYILRGEAVVVGSPSDKCHDWTDNKLLSEKHYYHLQNSWQTSETSHSILNAYI